MANSIKTKLGLLRNTAIGTISLNGFIQGYCAAVAKMIIHQHKSVDPSLTNPHWDVIRTVWNTHMLGFTQEELIKAGVSDETLRVLRNNWQQLNT